MHMLHWKRNSLRALWMGQKLERTSLFCRRFCPAWLESEEVHPGESCYSAFPLLWQHANRTWLRGRVWTYLFISVLSFVIHVFEYINLCWLKYDRLWLLWRFCLSMVVRLWCFVPTASTSHSWFINLNVGSFSEG
jgi:hypothetical protein